MEERTLNVGWNGKRYNYFEKDLSVCYRHILHNLAVLLIYLQLSPTENMSTKCLVTSNFIHNNWKQSKSTSVKEQNVLLLFKYSIGILLGSSFVSSWMVYLKFMPSLYVNFNLKNCKEIKQKRISKRNSPLHMLLCVHMMSEIVVLSQLWGYLRTLCWQSSGKDQGLW